MAQLFGAKLRFLRRQQGFTQTEVAQRVGLASHAHLAGVEAGRDTISLKTAILIAQMFGVSMRYLICDDVPVDQPQALSVPLVAPELIPQVFGAHVRHLREAQHISQAALSRQLQTTARSTINNLEAGRKAPSLELIVAIANALGVEEDALLQAGTASNPNT